MNPGVTGVRCVTQVLSSQRLYSLYFFLYFAKITTAMVTRAMLLNNTLWPQRAIIPIIFSLHLTVNQPGARPLADCTIMDAMPLHRESRLS
jgi:hypothetical protein